ncbi:MAG: hypothetical protein F4X02_14750 [Chloroflexi bacterium]|nr:hypothetical protein [Chloroflexota bacterium]
MMSVRLWRKLVAMDISDPIFRRVSEIRRAAAPSKPGFRAPRLLVVVAIPALIAALAHSPGLLALVLVIPMLMLTLMVATPVLLPLAVIFAGASLTFEVIGGIYREKHQHTYELICASTRGALKASWSFAAGVLYRSDWFLPLRWGTVLSCRCGLAALGGLGLLTLWTALFGPQAVGMEQLRLLAVAALLLALYYSNMTQTLALSLLVGLYASSFDLSRNDGMTVGVFLHLALTSLPLAVGGLAFVVFGRAAFDSGPLLRTLAEGGSLLLIVALRELQIALLWRALARRLEWGRGEKSATLRQALVVQ